MNNPKQDLLANNHTLCLFVNENTKLLFSNYNKLTCAEIAQKIEVLTKDNGDMLTYEEKIILASKIVFCTKHLREQHIPKNLMHYSTNNDFLFSATYLIDLIKLKEQEKTTSHIQNKED